MSKDNINTFKEKNKDKNGNLFPVPVLPQQRLIPIEEKIQYVKDNMDKLSMPIQIHKLDEMLVLIKTDWKNIGHECYGWVEECYFNLKSLKKTKMSKDFNNIEVNDSGYRNTQVVEGYMHISVPDVFEELRLDVEEVSSGTGGHDVYMFFDLMSYDADEVDKIEEYFGSAIEFDEEKEVYLIVDNDIISDLFSQYGNNA